MRLAPNRFTFSDKPAIIKKSRAKLVHVSPPIKGLAEDAKSSTVDAKYAGYLKNYYIEDDRIRVRAGTRWVAKMAGEQPVEHLIPYYGSPERMLAATNKTFCDALTGALLKAGFSNNDWHWASHSDLGDVERTVMVNGADGVWSWDGLQAGDVGPVTIVSLKKATPPKTNAIVTVASTDISKFKEYAAIIITGADSGHANANGSQRIVEVGTTPNTFELDGVDSTNWGGDQTTGTMRAVVQGSFVLEAVKPPEGNTWLSPNDLSIVVPHQNRLFFADENNLAVYYLPLYQRYGELKILPMNAIFRRGGTIRAMNTWTMDSGIGMDDVLVIFTSHGECAIYSGVDPDTDFTLVGVYRFDPTPNKYCTINYGGELYVLLPTGLTPLSATIKSGRVGIEAADKTVVSHFLLISHQHFEKPGWELFINPSRGRIYVNVPEGGGVYHQMVKAMAKSTWTEFRDMPSRCWGWIDPYAYFGDDRGNVYELHSNHLSDEIVLEDNATKQKVPIYTDVQMAWNQFKTPAIKHFKMILPYIITDGNPKPSIDIKVDYDTSPPFNVPEITEASEASATWDVSPWPEDPAADPIKDTFWVSGSRNWTNWTGVASIGRVGAVRMTAAISDCTFSVLGWDILYDEGSIFG